MLLTRLMLKNLLKFQVRKFTLVNCYHYNMVEQPQFYTNKQQANYLFAEYEKKKNIDFNDSLNYLKRLYLIWKNQKFDLQDHRWIEISNNIFQSFDSDKISIFDKIVICNFYRIIAYQEKFKKTSQILKQQINKMDINQLSNFIFTQQSNREIKIQQMKHLQVAFIAKLKQNSGQKPIKIKILSIQNEEYLSYEQIKVKINQEKSKNNETQNWMTRKNINRLIVAFSKFKVYREYLLSSFFRNILIQTLFITNKFQQHFYQVGKQDLLYRIFELKPRMNQWMLILPHVQLVIKSDPKNVILMKTPHQGRVRIMQLKRIVGYIRMILRNQDTLDQSYKQTLLQIQKRIKKYFILAAKNYVISKRYTKNESDYKFINSKILEFLTILNCYEEQIFSPILSDVMIKIDKYNVLNLIRMFQVIDKAVQKYNIQLKNQKEIIKQKLWEIYPTIQQDNSRIKFHQYITKFSMINEVPQNIKMVYNQNEEKINKIIQTRKILNLKKDIKTNHDENEKQLMQQNANEQAKLKILFGHKYFQSNNNKLNDTLFLKANNLLDQQQTEQIQEYSQQNIQKVQKQKQKNPLFNKISSNKLKQKNNLISIQKNEVKSNTSKRVFPRKRQNKSKKDIQIEGSNKVKKEPQEKKSFLKIKQQNSSMKEKNSRKIQVDKTNKIKDQKVIIQKDMNKTMFKRTDPKQQIQKKEQEFQEKNLFKEKPTKTLKNWLKKWI